MKKRLIFLLIFFGIFFILALSFESSAYYVRYNESFLSTTNFNQSLNITNITNFNAQVYNETWLDFNGTNEFVDFGNSQSLNTSNNFTISIWVNGNNVTGGTSRYILTKGVTNSFEWSLHTNQSNITNFVIFNTLSNNYRLTGSSTKLLLNKWYHIMVSTNDTNTSMYINGNFEGIGGGVTGTREIDGIAKVMAGTRQTASTNKLWNGSLDDIRIYNFSLSRNQAQRFYNESLHGSGLGISIPVLAYHQIREPEEADTVVNLSNFADQMAWLNSSGYTTITYDNFTNWTKGLEKLPKKPIILVFDDGWSSVYYNATPIMNNYSFMGVAGIIISKVGTGNYMTWTEINTLKNSGWQIASHSMNHTSLLVQSLSSRLSDFNDTRYAIYGNISYLPNMWIYPYNANNDTTDSECMLFYTICSGHGTDNTILGAYLFKNANLTHEDGNPIGLRRTLIENKTTMKEFIDVVDYHQNIVLDHNFNEFTGNITYDQSGFGNNGAITGAKYNTTGILINIFNTADYILSSIQGFFNLITNNYNTTLIHVNYNATPIFINYTGFPINITVEMYELNNALIFYVNNTAICSDVNTCDGNKNVTISNLSKLYIMDNFNLTEGTNRQFSPIWIVSSDVHTKKITSNITQNSNFNSYLSISPKTCTQLNKVTETSASGSTSIIHTSLTCENGILALSLTNVENSLLGHEIILGYEGDGICDSWEDSFTVDCNPSSSSGGGGSSGNQNQTIYLNKTNIIYDRISLNETNAIYYRIILIIALITTTSRIWWKRWTTRY